MSELFVPKNPIETAQEPQWQIALASAEEAPRLAAYALDVLGNAKEIYGSRRLFIHTLGAYVLDRGRCQSEKNQCAFDDVYLKGLFSKITYIQSRPDQSDDEVNFQTLVVDLWDAQIYKTVLHPDMPVSDRLKSPMTIPVGNIQSVMVGP